MKNTFVLCFIKFLLPITGSFLAERTMRESVVFLFAIIFCVTAGACPESVRAEEAQHHEVLEFLGALNEKDAKKIVVENDQILVSVERRVNQNAGNQLTKYYFLLKNVPAIEKNLLEDAKDGKWDNFDLFRASLISEGILTVSEIKSYEKNLDKIVASLRSRANEGKGTQNQEELIRNVYEAMHKEVFTGTYKIEDSSPAAALDSGNFNCVSATIIYNAIAQKLGLEASGLEMSGHVLSRVKCGTKNIDIETTCPTWFESGNSAEKRNANGAAESYAQTSPKSRNNGTDLNASGSKVVV
ncbi:MAG: transglutaminase family protein, partial [Thermoguttaceae bacterium]